MTRQEILNQIDEVLNTWCLIDSTFKPAPEGDINKKGVLIKTDSEGKIIHKISFSYEMMFVDYLADNHWVSIGTGILTIWKLSKQL